MSILLGFLCNFFAFVSYCTYAFTTIPSNLIKNTTSICLLMFIILTWVYVFYIVVVLICYNEKVRSIVMKGLLFFGRNCIYLQNISLFSFVIVFAFFMIKFTPISNSNCRIYANLPNACLVSQSIAMIGYCVLCTCVIYLTIACCINNLKWIPRICSNNNIRILPRETWPRETVPGETVPGETVPGETVPGDSSLYILLKIAVDVPIDRKCAICFFEYDLTNNGPWCELPCKHTFHHNCIAQWIVNKNTCPLCRANIRNST